MSIFQVLSIRDKVQVYRYNMSYICVLSGHLMYVSQLYIHLPFFVKNHIIELKGK